MFEVNQEKDGMNLMYDSGVLVRVPPQWHWYLSSGCAITYHIVPMVFMTRCSSWLDLSQLYGVYTFLVHPQ